MGHPIGTAAVRHHDHDADADPGWSLVQAAARAAEGLAGGDTCQSFALAPDGQLRPVAPGDPDGLIAWRPGAGWEGLLPLDDPRRAFIDLYLPICSATTARPITVGHLGQSLDGFIATHAGESHWITGEQNIIHMHRLRALCDAVVVGAGDGCGRRSAAHHPARRRPEPVARRDRSRPASRRPLPRLH